jgi:hypothetical protein
MVMRLLIRCLQRGLLIRDERSSEGLLFEKHGVFVVAVLTPGFVAL